MRILFQRRNFALVWCAGLISMLGDRALFTALPFYVYQQTGSTLATAAMFTAFYVPPLLLGSLAGVFVDRWDRKRIMFSANLIQAIVLLLLLHVQDRGMVWLVYVVSFLEFAIATFLQPAESAMLPSLVDMSDLVTANALMSMSVNFARLTGPAAGGLLMASLGLASVVLFDSTSFVIAAALLSVLSLTPESAHGTVEHAATIASAWTLLWREWSAGLRIMRHDDLIARLFIVACVTSFGGAMFDPLIAPWVASVLRGTAASLGWLFTAGAIGGLLGGLLLARVGAGKPPALLNAFGNILAGSLLLVTYNFTALPVVLILSVLTGLPLAGSGAGLQTLLQIAVPDTYRGRVYGSLNATVALVALVSLWLAGSLGEQVGTVPMLSLASGITLAAGLLALAILPKCALPELLADRS